MTRDTTPAVDAIGELHLTGNIVPQTWYKAITTPAGKPNLAAITILADIAYWYRPTVRRDEATGEISEVRKKFAGDKLQRTYESYVEQFGLSKHLVQEAIKALVRQGLVTREFRTLTTETGLVLTNVMYLEPVAEKMAAISAPSFVRENSKTGGGSPQKPEGDRGRKWGDHKYRYFCKDYFRD